MKIAILQALSRSGDYVANLERLNSYAQQAKEQGAALLITAEMFLSGYVLGDKTQLMAETFPLEQLKKIAQTQQIGLIVGGPRLTKDGVMNSAYFIDDHGQLLNCYDKTHLFGQLDHAYFQAGQGAVVLTEFGDLKIAMLICYDVEFPETVRAAAHAGANLIAVLTAQMQPYYIVNTQVIPVRAWENQVYVAYVNQIGIEHDYHYVGLSSVVAPTGEFLVLASEDQEQLLFAEISAQHVQQAQQQNPYLKDVRIDLFS